MKIICTSDLHLGIQGWGKLNSKTGLNTMVEKFLDEFEKTGARVASLKADLWILAGDIFHTPNPTNVVRQGFTRVINRVISQGVQILIVTGNSHDRPMSFGAQHSLAELEAMDIPGLTIVSESQIISYGDLNVICLPWQKNPQAIVDDAQRLIQSVKVEDKSIIVGHFTVSGAMTGSEKAFELYGDGTVPIEAVMDPKVNFTFLGHIHKHQRLFEKVMYIGSMDRVDFGERFEEKGSIQFDWSKETGVVYIKRILGTPQNYVQLDQIDGKWTSDWKTENIDGAVVKVKIKCTQEERRRFDFHGLYQALSTAKYVLQPVFETPEEAKRQIDERMSIELTFEDSLKLWLEKQQDIEPATRAKILKAGKELLADPL